MIFEIDLTGKSRRKKGFENNSESAPTMVKTIGY
jgi:hypothetical protein